MTPQEILNQARHGDLGTNIEPLVLAEAVLQLANSGDAASSLELVGRGWRVWTSSRRLEEGSAAAGAALRTPGAEGVRPWYARSLYADGVLAFRAGDEKRSRARNEEALRIAREGGDARGESDALSGLARLALREGDYTGAASLARAARDRARASGDPEDEATPLHLEAAGVRMQGDHPAARELYIASIELNRRLDNPERVTMEQHNLGWVELHLGNIAAAESAFSQRDAAAGSDAYGDAWSELNWAAVAARKGESAESRRRFDAGMRSLKELGVVLDPDDRMELEWLKDLIGTAAC